MQLVPTASVARSPRRKPALRLRPLQQSEEGDTPAPSPEPSLEENNGTDDNAENSDEDGNAVLGLSQGSSISGQTGVTGVSSPSTTGFGHRRQLRMEDHWTRS